MPPRIDQTAFDKLDSYGHFGSAIWSPGTRSQSTFLLPASSLSDIPHFLLQKCELSLGSPFLHQWVATQKGGGDIMGCSKKKNIYILFIPTAVFFVKLVPKFFKFVSLRNDEV